MTNRLFICEKPSQARDIAKVLGARQKQEGWIEGNQVVVTWCLGHLLETAKPDFYRDGLKPWRVEALPVVPEQWTMQPVAKVKKQLITVKKLIKESSHIVIATDADREGELIAREVLEHCKYRGHIERLWLSALDDESIRKALNSIRPGSETEALYHAGLGRQRADWLVGMNMTMGVSAQFGKYGEGVLSVGRVQTPTLKLIVDRDESIEKFKSQDFYELFANFMDQSQTNVWLKWLPKKELHEDDQGHILTKDVAEQAAAKISGQPAVLEQLTKTKKKQSPPLPFTLSALQKKTSAMLGFSAKKTLSVAQELYEKHKLITYPRTDSAHLPVSQFQEARDVISAAVQVDQDISGLANECDTQFRSPAWNDKKVHAHHGIIPTTSKSPKLASLSSDCAKVYQIIRDVYLAQFLGNFVYMHTSMSVDCAGEKFIATGKVPLQLGWKKALSKDKWGNDTKEDNETSQSLPNWEKDEGLQETKHKVMDKKTKPPAHFTEGTLIAAMESVGKYVEDKALKKVLKETSGIGTQATRASIIELLISRKYISRDKKKLISTEKGRNLISVIPDIVKDPATTARWEHALDDVANGAHSLDDFLSSQKSALQEMLSAISNVDRANIQIKAREPSKNHPCPSCKKPLRKRKAKSRNSYFWGCTGYPECSTTLPDNKGKPGKRKMPAKATDVSCEKCDSGEMIERKGKYGIFYGCSNYPKCKNISKSLESITT